MGRKLVVVLTSLIIFATTQAKALGLGDITLESALNQPLSARIALFDVGNLSVEDIRVVLASADDFDRFSLDRPFFLESIDFTVHESAGGAYIELSTTDPVREPYLSFVVEAQWPSGRLLSEYTVLLDLPVFGSQSVTQTAQPPARTETETRQPDTRQSAQPARNDVPQQAPERLAAPAPEPVDEETAPEADAQQDADAATEQEQQAAQPETTQDAVDADTIVVEPEDTLWDIALQVRPDSSVSVQQTMLALQELNQDAFIGDNINMIRRGQVLRVPDAEQIRAITQQQAIAEVGRQNQLFSDRRNVPLTSELLTAPPEPADNAAAPGRGELSVVTADPQEADADSGAGDEAARIAQLENELAVSTEEVDRIRLQNNELTERLAMLDEQIASAQEIIRLRDLELAQLQQTLAQQAQTPAATASAADTAPANTAAPVPADAEQPAAQPTVVTMAPEPGLPQRLLDALMENSWALLAGVVLVILLLVFLLLRRNRAAEEYAALAAADAELQDEDDVDSGSLYTASPAVVAGAAPAAEFTFDEFDDLKDFDDDVDDETAPVDSADATSLAADREEEELLDEVDAFIAYERYPEARTLLQNAIVANPSRPALRLKLLELYAVTQDVMGFHLQEAELRGMADAGMLARVEELRRRLPEEDETDLPLPVARDDVADLTATDELEIELDLGASAEVDDQRVLSGLTADEVDEEDVGAEPINNESDDDFDFDLDDDYSPETVEAGSADAGADLDDDEFELDDLPLEEPSVKEATAADDVIEFEEPGLADAARFHAPSEDQDEDESADQASARPEEAADDIESVDFDFSLDDLSLDDTDDLAETEADEVTETEAIAFEISDDDAPAAVHAVATDDELDEDLDTIEFTSDDADADVGEVEDEFDPDDLSFLTDSDEATTKLDLARAYIDMGDRDGAREILEEVLQEGTDEQIRDAEALLAKTLQA